jgi:hypothetical protein
MKKNIVIQYFFRKHLSLGLIIHNKKDRILIDNYMVFVRIKLMKKYFSIFYSKIL